VAIGVNASVTSGDIASLTATTTITKPTGTASTDVLIVVFGTDFGGSGPAATVTAPAGWAAVNAAFTVTNGNGNVRLTVFWAPGSVANLGFTNSLTGSSHQEGWICVGFTGVDVTTPIDATAATNSSINSTTLTTNAVTVATAGAWHCIPTVDWLGSAADLGAPGFTRQQNASGQANSTLLYNTTAKSAGSTGTVVVTSANAASGQIIEAMPFALRPAGGAAFVARRPYALGQAVPRAAFY
jgi:hypothetical protein